MILTVYTFSLVHFEGGTVRNYYPLKSMNFILNKKRMVVSINYVLVMRNVYKLMNTSEVRIDHNTRIQFMRNADVIILSVLKRKLIQLYLTNDRSHENSSAEL